MLGFLKNSISGSNTTEIHKDQPGQCGARRNYIAGKTQHPSLVLHSTIFSHWLNGRKKTTVLISLGVCPNSDSTV